MEWPKCSSQDSWSSVFQGRAARSEGAARTRDAGKRLPETDFPKGGRLLARKTPRRRFSRHLKRLLLIILLLEIPFSYKVCQSRELNQYLTQLPAARHRSTPFADLRGTLHVHSAAGGHSLATYPEILQTARELNFDYLLFTEHPRDPSVLNQIDHPELVVIYGEELTRDGHRYLTAGDHSMLVLTELSSLEPEYDSIPPTVTALEIYNMHENAEQRQSLIQWINFLHHQLTYPELFYFHLWELRHDHIAFWDNLLRDRQIAATAGNDAHQNVGIILQTAAGQRLFSIQLDPYRYTLQFVTNHVVLERDQPATPDTVLDALAAGASYVAFEGLADPTGFSFHARSEGQALPMGATVGEGTPLVFQSPLPSRFHVFRNGALEQELEGTRFDYPAKEGGAYRVEVHLLDPPPLLEGKPWIISNPIYVSP